MVEWLVVVYDKPVFKPQDRGQFRPQHLAAIPAQVESGKVTNVGAIFHEIPEDDKPKKFAGSSLNVVANSREEVIEILNQDIFAKEGIWDVENALIYPYGVAKRVAKD
ncbi:hypothetical protein BN7_6441 [Wickerhamomyces ciferrii]|uniref:YCII-related domain-containing protein n=1 Tax=Wickerhamomyces ciferrii (strain ATCC 14091 / BCRC 22168 / CBS 111 / JCM 3599 / NBRC 0793 / NRRL Y-1031 F-60-10) TaxID=1206466 RepID=K0KNL3_WICCF|nr:uncharacterized protein BN7_6441 [Wickerhamomyces ciferrii]CCH46840.1 hypothetical protein BN7_6441 [Wickerhamomyces ciferrii]